MGTVSYDGSGGTAMHRYAITGDLFAGHRSGFGCLFTLRLQHSNDPYFLVFMSVSLDLIDRKVVKPAIAQRDDLALG